MTKANVMQALVAPLLGLNLLAMPLIGAAADGHNDRRSNHDPNKRIAHIRGITVTGVNSVLGEPFFSWGEPYGASFNFPTMGSLNKYGADPLRLDANTPKSAILVSWVDPLFLSLFGKPADYVVNPEWVNVPLRNAPVNVDFAGVKKQALHGVRDATPLELAQADPANPITLGQWMEAGGVVTIDCSADGADVKLRMRHLIPNRIYSVWATMGLPSQSGTVPAAFPIPIGGAPNVFTSDETGDGTFRRWIKFCPLDTQSTDSPMLFIDVQFNANHQTYGAVIAPGFIDGNWPGVITFSHVVFPINVELLGK